jgi:peptidoglycan hydrolase-like protein with peptidoglycan-binding domain
MIEFQRAHGLEPDGRVGARRMRELERQVALTTLE